MLIEWSHTQFDLRRYGLFAGIICGCRYWASWAHNGRICGRRTPRRNGNGLVGAAWSLTGYMAILDGIDPLTFGIAWFAVGMCWMVAQQQYGLFCSG